MKALTARQTEILDLIRRYQAENGYPPTRAEIAAMLGFRSINAAEEHLRALARKGVIELLPGASRGIRISRQYAGLPVVGQVAAGSPVLAEQHIEDYYSLEPDLFRPAAHYLLRVKGMSMRDAGILDGDLLAVHSQPDAENGQVVVVRLDDEVTVKRIHQHGPIVSLLPANDEYQPMRVDLRKQSLSIEGLGVGVIRNQIPLNT